MTWGRTIHRLIAAAAAALLAACSSSRSVRPPSPAAPASGWTERAFVVPDHGRLVLSIPPEWTVEEGDGDGEAGLTAIRLGRPEAGFTALLSPIWNPGEPESPDARADAAHLFADLARRAALAGSVERELHLQEVSGPGVQGFWFTATDRELGQRTPEANEWREMLQGAASVGPVILAFTLLDDGPGPQRAELLELVRTARHLPDGARREVSTLEPMPDARTVPLRVASPGKPWAVLVDLPGFRVAARREGEGRGALVLGVEPRTGITVTVGLHPAGTARDALGCRDAALAAISSAVPALTAVRAEGAPPVARLSYEAPAVGTNVHAFLHRDGLCVNVHASQGGSGAFDAERVEAILATIRFAEDL
jgi:hypothetical protein